MDETHAEIAQSIEQGPVLRISAIHNNLLVHSSKCGCNQPASCNQQHPSSNQQHPSTNQRPQHPSTNQRPQQRESSYSTEMTCAVPMVLRRVLLNHESAFGPFHGCAACKAQQPLKHPLKHPLNYPITHSRQPPHSDHRTIEVPRVRIQ